MSKRQTLPSAVRKKRAPEIDRKRSKLERSRSVRSARANIAACTIISRNYLSHARILAESFRKHHPESAFYVLVVDGLPASVEIGPGVQVLEPDILDIPYFYELCFKYDVTELSTAVKPSLLRSLLRQFGEPTVVYYDPDILITRPQSELLSLLNDSNIVLTPHLLAPIPVDGLKPSEQDILRDGAYNLGFIAIRNCDESERFLHWWEERLRHFCRIDPANGLFTDQKWINLIPGMFEHVSILRDETYNVAYWNLHSRSLTYRGKQFQVNGRPLGFFHFSGFDPLRPQILSKHQTRNSVMEETALAQLLNHYARLQLDHGFAECRTWSYGCAEFRNGVPIHSLLRHLYLSLDAETRTQFGNPFETSDSGSFFDWVTTPSAEYRNLSPFLHELYRTRYDVAAAFPDLESADRERFVQWAQTQGVKEMGFDLQLLTPATGPIVEVRRNGQGHLRARAAATASDSVVRSPETMPPESYRRVIAETQTLAEAYLPAGAIVAVASRGDNDLLDIPGRTGWHFPQLSDGTYAGYYPSESGHAIAHLQALRQRGAQFLLFPATARWWLEHYPDLRVYLESHTTKLEIGDDSCVIFDLRKSLVMGPDSMQGFGVNVAGYIASEKGMGEGVRSDLRGLEAAGIPFAVNNFVDTGSHNVDGAYQSFAEDNPYPINLIHINADQVPGFARSYGEAYFRGRYNIGYWAWELSSFPQKWQESFRYFDEIWVPSNFVLDAVSRESSIPVVRIPHSLPETLPTDSSSRATFGIPDDHFVFLFMFDCHSFVERKNPFGLIRAFRTAFAAGDDVTLVLKCSHASFEQMQELRQAAERTNLVLLNSVFTREQTNRLVSLCDCYVSLHRSEGFGLTMAEAMSLEKPVIATGYSGNMDFMTVANSFPVQYTLTEITENHGPYRKGNVWAEPDLNHAAERMRFVYEHPDEAKAVGRRARRDVLDQLRPSAVGKLMSHRLAHAAETQRRRAVQAENAPAVDPSPTPPDAYQGLVKSICDLAPIVIPANSTVLVVSHGDEQLLQLGERTAWHFPKDASGAYAGYHPRDGQEAIARLEDGRAEGAGYLLFPATVFWWLSHYPELRDHLESRYRRSWADERCIIYQLVPNESQLLIQLRTQMDDSRAALQRLADAVQLNEVRSMAVEQHNSAISIQLNDSLKEFDEFRQVMQAESTTQFERQQSGLTQLSNRLAGIEDRLAARPYMSVDIFSMNHLDGPLGYAVDAANLEALETAPQDFSGLFRGPESFIADRQRVYLPFVRNRRQVVDLGCGRGEFLQLLKENGIDAVGVESDAKLVERLQGQGLRAVAADALDYLREQADGSLDVIFSAQVIEHLDPPRMRELLHLAKAKLGSGGILIAETVNPESDQALKAFWVDLTHQHPIFPQVLLQMCREARFPSARIFYPVHGGFTQRNYQVAGEYAVIAIA